jgi:hypothetical protein
MSFYAWAVVLFLAMASVVGIVVFLTQYRTRRAAAMAALVVTMFATLSLCAFTFLGGSFQL